MDHPSVMEILAAAGGETSSEIERHLASCDACRALAGLAAADDERRPLADEIEERRTIAERLALLPRITAVAEAIA